MYWSSSKPCLRFRLYEKYKILSLVALGVSIAGYNAAVLFIPLLLLRYESVLILLKDFFFIFLGFAILSSFGIFYYLNPKFVIHNSPSFSFSVYQFFISLSTLRVINVIIESFPMTWLFGILLIFINKKNKSVVYDKRLLFAVAATFLIICFFLSLEKIGDFTNSYFFSGTRFFLAVPYVTLVLVVYIINMYGYIQFSNKVLLSTAFLVLLASISSTVKSVEYFKVNADKEALKPAPVMIGRRQYVIDNCKYIATTLKKFDFYGKINGRNDLLVYGCDVFSSAKIYQTYYDRRYWLEEKIKSDGKLVGNVPLKGVTPLF